MFKVRIKTSPGETNPKSTGQQESYGLVRNLRGMQNSPEQYAVNDTMGAIPRDQANIEVEGGESVIGDINKDGIMELMYFNGKRHTEGGIPVNIPEGSFIFSDTKNLTIKDPEVLEKIFNLPFRKQGYTPGEISKKYDINMYVQILKDETSDPLAKRSAAEMLKKNKQKLGLLAFIQESMKGFPDGIPTIAEEVLSSMGIDPNQMAQQFAPQQQQGQMMPPSQEGQGIPMSEDESAMQGMIPEGPAVAPEDLANQFSGKFGGVMPRYEYEDAGTVESACPPMYAWNPYVKKCVLTMYSKSKTGIPPVAYADYSESIGLPSLYQQRPIQNKVTEEEAFDPRALLANAQTQRVKIKNTPKVEPISGSMQVKGNPYAKKYDPETGEELENITYDKAEEDRKAADRLAKEELRLAKDKRDNPYKNDIPGFGSASDLKDYMSENYQQQVAGDTFYKALLSNDPGQMIRAAEDIKNIDVPWNVGWLPWTDQDKIDDMYTILHEEALKKLNEKQKDIILKDYNVNTVKTKLNDIITKYQKLRDDATDVATKLKYAEDLDKYTAYKKQLIDNGTYNNYISGVKRSDVKSNTQGWFAHDYIFANNELGTPIQDQYVDYYGREFNAGPDDETTMMSILEDITKAHDILKKTNVASTSPLAFKGQTSAGGTGRGDTMSFGDPSASFEMFNTESKVKDVYSKLYGKGSPKDAKGYNPRYTINAAPGSTFVMDKNEDGQMLWYQTTEDGADLEVANPEWVTTLNSLASNKEGRKVFLRPSKAPVELIDMLEEEQRLNPPLVPTKVKPKTNVTTPIDAKPKQKYETEGVNDALFDELFGKGSMKFGGTMKSIGSDVTIGDKVFRYGGLINENGKLRYDRGGSVLPKYGLAGTVTDPTDPVKGPETTVTVPGKNEGKPMVKYEETYASADGNPAHITVVEVIKDQASGNILGRRNRTTGEAIPNNAMITRSSYDYVTSKDQLNDYEKKVLANNWNGNEKEYINFLNSKNQLFTNKDLRQDIYKQFKGDVANVEAYTGTTPERKQQFKDKYYSGLSSMSEQDMMEELLAQEERNARLAVYGHDVFGSGQQADAASNTTNQKTWDFVKNTPGLRDLYDANSGAGAWTQGQKGQAAYIAYQRTLTENSKYKDQKLAEFQQGVGDESIFGIKGKVSGIDRFSNNTTLGQRLGYSATPPKPIPVPGKKQAYYCVDYEDGTKDVQSVPYKDDAQPIGPVVGSTFNGKVVKAFAVFSNLTDAETICKTGTIITTKTPPAVQSPTWFAPDIVNYAAASRQIIPNTPPTLQQISQPISGYDTINPITRIAGTTGLVRQQQDLAMNTMDAPVAFAATANQGYQNLAEQIGGVEEYNVSNIVNPYLTRVGNLAVDVDYKNSLFNQAFNQEGAVYQEELAAQRNKKAAQEAMLYGQGFGNVQKDNALRVANPNAWHAQRLNPTFAWSGVGLDPLGANTMTSANGLAQQDCSTVYATEYARVKDNAGMPEAAKIDYATKMQQACISQNNTQMNRTQQQQYNAGITNMFDRSRYGGTMYTAPGAMEYGGMFYDDDNN